MENLGEIRRVMVETRNGSNNAILTLQCIYLLTQIMQYLLTLIYFGEHYLSPGNGSGGSLVTEVE